MRNILTAFKEITDIFMQITFSLQQGKKLTKYPQLLTSTYLRGVPQGHKTKNTAIKVKKFQVSIKNMVELGLELITLKSQCQSNKISMEKVN